MKKKQTIQKKTVITKSTKTAASEPTPINYQELTENAPTTLIEIHLIDDSPFNRRRVFSIRKLEELAANIKSHGVLHNIIVRPMPEGRFQLMGGHRRTRASRMVGLQRIPAKIVEADDELAKKFLFGENAHREDQHHMDEAYSIGDMKADNQSVEDIAKSIGKSKAFVHTRLQLLNLIEPLQEVFMADKFGLHDALELSALSPESQAEIFDEELADWQAEDFEMPSLHPILTRYCYDLKKAPFDTTDQTLIPEAGACHGCRFNSASITTLFPELNVNATCTNKGCFRTKCQVQLEKNLSAKLAEGKVDGLLFYGHPSESTIKLLENIGQTVDLPRYSVHDVATKFPPDLPDREDYNYEDENMDGVDETGFATEEYNTAMNEYQEELEQFKQEYERGDWKKGLVINGEEITNVMFDPERKFFLAKKEVPRLTVKLVQDAINAGTATVELLQQEVDRITAREERAKELDKIKIQETTHEQFLVQFADAGSNILTDADQTGARLIIYQSLDLSTKEMVHKSLFGNGNPDSNNFLTKLAKLSDSELAYLIRMGIACKYDSKLPNHITGKCLYKLAEAGGIDVQAIEKEQAAKAKQREQKSKSRVKELHSKIKRMKQSA